MTTKKPLHDSFFARAAAGLRYAFTGKDWFGAGQPLEPVAPEETKGRQFDYPSAINTNHSKPRQSEGISFAQLRALADNYDLMRLIIERRKDQLAKLSWTIQKRDIASTSKKESAARDNRIDTIIAFLRNPDKEHTWDDWLRMLIEDLLVLDAPCIYPRKTIGGELYALEPVDGSTIKRLLDDTGRTPLPPEPAYQQILHGVPANNYTRQELIYRPRNLRTNKVYGYSPVEQVITSVNIAMRRQLHQLDYYQSGSVPDALIGVPDTWSMQEIERFQVYWDSLLAGESAEKRKLRFAPGDLARNFVETKQPPLKDQYDEWLARIICFCFSIDPTPFVAQVNRATAETSQEQALAEGLAPLQNWVKSVIDNVLLQFFNAPDLEFKWDEENAIDPKVQADINCMYVNAGVLTVDEVRANLGYDPMPPAEQPEEEPLGRFEQQDDEEQSNNVEKSAKKTYRPINRNRPAVVGAIAEAEQIIEVFLQQQAKDLAKQITAHWDNPNPELAKVDGSRVNGIVSNLIFATWTKLAKKLFPLFKRIFTDGAKEAFASIGITHAGKMREIRSLAVAWADYRAAEMVGMRWVGNILMPNPNAKWQITESTREMLRGLVTKALEQGLSADELKNEIMQHTAFSKSRAAMIARTEIGNADMAGTMAGWEKTGLVVGKRWKTAGDSRVADICMLNSSVGAIPLKKAFPSGKMHPLNHPNCRCDLLPVMQGEEAKLNHSQEL